MPRALSWAVIAAAFLAGVFLPDLVANATVAPRKPVSAVAVEGGPETGAPPVVAGLAPGGALRTGPDGAPVLENEDLITALNARDPSALVFSTGHGGSCAQTPPCDCSQDDLHRYKPKKTRKKDLGR